MASHRRPLRQALTAAAVLVLALATAIVPSQANAEVWDDDGGLVFFGNGYHEPTAYEDAYNALEGRSLTQLAGTSDHVCAIDDQGEAVCWGDAEDGRHGTGARNFPPAGPAEVDMTGVLSGKTLVDIDAGRNFTCALDDTGRAYCWGGARQGQLGRLAATEYSPVTVPQSGLPKGDSFIDITTGAHHACGISNEGDAFCWGDGSSGQLGRGDRHDYAGPRRVKPGEMTERRLVSIDAGDAHTCAADAAGRLYCWGEGSSGRLGTGSTRDQLLPTRVEKSGPGGQLFEQVSAGAKHTCASNESRRLFCWGANDSHQATGSRSGRIESPERVSLGDVSSFSTGREHSCASAISGIVFCWGSNRSGQIGDGTRDLAKHPTLVESNRFGLGGNGSVQVQALENTTCATDADGNAYCWGSVGAYMQNSVSLGRAKTPERVAYKATGLDGFTLTGLTDAGFNWCGLKTPSQPVCHSYGSFGSPFSGSRGNFRTIPTTGTFDGDPLRSLDTGVQVACGVNGSGLAYCWGEGPLGAGSDHYSINPVAVDTSGVLAGRSLVDVSVDEAHACAIDDTGKAFCWGSDDGGSLGNGKGDHSDVPDNVASQGVLAGETLVDIETSSYSTCALSDDGEVFCWGSSVGDGTREGSERPVRADLSLITPGETVTSLHGMEGNTCLLTDAGHAYCWGNSWVGQTGTGAGTGNDLTRATPVVRDGVLTGVELVDLAMAGLTSMCGLGTNGRLYCWGQDLYGALGNGSFNGSSDVPVAVVHTRVLAGATITDLGAAGGTVWAVTEEAP